jgi:hypothetical protein
MAVTTPYNYFNRQILDTEKHNGNVYSTNSGQGIVSEINGGINTYSSDYRIQKEHIWPEEAVRTKKDFAIESVDYFSDAMAQTDDTTYRAVAGCATRVYVPYDATLSLWQWSAFIHPFKIRGTTSAAGDPANVATASVFVKAFLNGVSLEHTKRTIPTTAVYRDDNESFAGTDRRVQEQRFSLQFDMSHLQENVTAGWHDISLKLYVEPILDPNTSAAGEETLLSGKVGDESCVFHHRISFGVRNARVLTIL